MFKGTANEYVRLGKKTRKDFVIENVKPGGKNFLFSQKQGSWD